MDVWFPIVSFVGSFQLVNLICKDIYSIVHILIKEKMEQKYPEYLSGHVDKGYNLLHYYIQLMAYNRDWECIAYLLDQRQDPELIIHTVTLLHMYEMIEQAKDLFRRNRRVMLNSKGKIKKNKKEQIPYYPAVYAFYAEQCNISYQIPEKSYWNSENALGFVTPKNQQYYKYRDSFFLEEKLDTIYTRKTFCQWMLEVGLPDERYPIDVFIFYLTNTGSCYMPQVITRKMTEQMNNLCQKYGGELHAYVPALYLYACGSHHKENVLETLEDEEFRELHPGNVHAIQHAK